MQIRPYTQHDEKAIVQLWQACGLTRPWNNPSKDIERKLRVQRDMFLVGYEEGQLVASIMAGYDGHRGWINYLAVAPEHQGKGYGRQLMNAAEQKLIALGCPKINLQVRRDNEQARNFYQALGFQEDAVISFGKRLIPDS